jgi:Secretion system C-terminal sorting domain
MIFKPGLMKKLLPVLALSLVLVSMNFNISIARLIEGQNLGEEPSAWNTDVQELKVSVYPNPVINNQINVTTNRDIQSIKILTIVGSVVLDREYEAGTTNVQLDLDKLSKGLYLLKIKFDEERTYTEKIMVK